MKQNINLTHFQARNSVKGNLKENIDQRKKWHQDLESITYQSIICAIIEKL